MDMTFIQYLAEGAKDRNVIKRIASAINSATNNEFGAKLSTNRGSNEPKLAITTKDGKIPSSIYDVFKTLNIGLGDKRVEDNENGSKTTNLTVIEL